MKISLLRMRTKFGRQDKRYITNPEDHYHYYQPGGPQYPINPQPVNPQHFNPTQINGNNVSPLSGSPHPLSPNHVGAHSPGWRAPNGVNGVGVAELDGMRDPLVVEREQYLLREQQQLEQAQKLHENRLEEKKQEKEKRRVLEEQRNASPESVRKLRQLIRDRHSLDMKVWNKRKVKRADRKIIEKDCVRADKVLQQIYFIVDQWKESHFGPEDWKVAKKIKDSLSEKDKHAVWESKAPWDREEDNDVYGEV